MVWSGGREKRIAPGVSGHKSYWEAGKAERRQRVQTEQGKENRAVVTREETQPTGKPFKISTD